jgi:hypothetical protein
MNDPWAFGWTQVLTIAGLLVTVGIAGFGFRSFGRWRREALESRRIDVALELLSLAYEAQNVFSSIRSPMAFGYEWQDMNVVPGETEDQRNRRGPYFAIRKRLVDNREFFTRAISMHPKAMAVFGVAIEEPFMELHRARRRVEVASEMLERDANAPEGRQISDELREQLLADIWNDYGDAMETKEGDRVGKHLKTFNEAMERLCRPIIGGYYGEKRRRPRSSRERGDGAQNAKRVTAQTP